MLPPSRCAPPPRFALPPQPLTLLPPPCRRQASATADVALARCRHRRRCAVALPPPPLTLPLLPCRLQAATNVTLLRCRHCHSLRAAATALPPLHCAPPPCFALPPPLLKLPPPPHRRHAAADATLTLVDCYIPVDSDAFLSPHPTPFLSIHPQITPYWACHTNHNKTPCGVVRSAHQPHGLRPNQAHASSPMVCG